MAQQQALTSRNLTEQILTTRRLRRRHIDVLNELPIAIFVTSNAESFRFQLVPKMFWLKTGMPSQILWSNSKVSTLFTTKTP